MRRRRTIDYIAVTSVFLICGVLSDPGDIPCSSNPCQNGGTCVLSSVLPALPQCKTYETRIGQHCVSFHDKPVNWTHAALTCENEQGRLVYISSEDDLVPLSQYMLMKVSGEKNNDTQRTLGVWSSVRSVQNGSIPAWVTIPGSRLTSQQTWAQNEPNQWGSWNDVCIAYTATSQFRGWTTYNCSSDLHYPVCMRSALQTETEEYYSQCRCPTGFEGARCELQQSQASQKTICGGSQLEFTCTTGGTIHVDYASYGTSTGCSSISSDVAQTCSIPHALSTISIRCQGQSYCSISNVSSLFSETPCGDSQHSLVYRMRCSDETSATCQKGASYLLGKCYQINTDNDQLNFDDAERQCWKKGGTLISPIDEQMNDELLRQLRKKSDKITFYWIGLRTTGQGVARWTNGQDVTFTAPNSSSLNSPDACGTYYVSKDSIHWTVRSCMEKANYICQYAPQTNDRQIEKYSTPEEYTNPVFKGTDPSNDQEFNFRKCKGHTDKKSGVKWEDTLECMEAIVACSGEKLTGNITRLCACGGTWEPARLECEHKWVNELKGASTNDSIPAEETSSKLKINIQESINEMYGKDISGTVDISKNLVNLARNQLKKITVSRDLQNRTNVFTDNINSAVDHLLKKGSAVEEVWNTFFDRTKRLSVAADLMSAMEQSAMIYAHFVANKSELAYDYYQNWIMGTSKQRADMQHDDRLMSAAAEPEKATDVKFAGINTQVIIPAGLFRSVIPPSGSEFSRDETMDMGDRGNQPMNDPNGEMMAANQAALQQYAVTILTITTLGSFMEPEGGKINSPITAMSINSATGSTQLPTPVNLVFPLLTRKHVKNPRCVYWNAEHMEWREDGVTMVPSTKDDQIVCLANHLTSFAVLMDLSGGQFGGSSGAIDVVSTIGCALSIVCLVLSLAVFTCFRSLYNTRNSIHRNLCFCLLIAELVFVIGVDKTGDSTACSVTALLLHYFFLAAFCWMLLEGYQLYLMLIQVFEPSRRRVLLYHALAYGAPAVVVAISAGTRWDQYGTDKYCWIDVSKKDAIWAFIAPILVVIAINICLLLVALRVVLSSKTKKPTTQKVFGWLKGSATLLCLLGITWLFGFLTIVGGKGATAFGWIFTILNCTQGVFIFILHVVMNDKVRGIVVRWMQRGVCCIPESQINSKSFLSSRQRLMNMVRGANSQSDPSTASTNTHKDTNKSTLTPASSESVDIRKTSASSEPTARLDRRGTMTFKSKTSAWLRKMSHTYKDDSSTEDNENTIKRSSRLSPAFEPTSISAIDMDGLDDATVSETSYPLFRSARVDLSPRGSCERETEEGERDTDRPDYRKHSTLTVDCETVEKRSPVRRQKFPIGATAVERASSRHGPVYVERF